MGYIADIFRGWLADVERLERERERLEGENARLRDENQTLWDQKTPEVPQQPVVPTIDVTLSEEEITVLEEAVGQWPFNRLDAAYNWRMQQMNRIRSKLAASISALRIREKK